MGVTRQFASSRTVVFGQYSLDLNSAELRRDGVTISKLPEQPFQVLSALLEHPGELVTREELRQRLWSEQTFVDFEHGLNVVVKRLRETLEDSAEHPVFIETIPRRGYRFIYPVSKPEPCTKDQGRRKPLHLRWWLWIGVCVGLAAALVYGYELLRARMTSRLDTPKAIPSLAVLPLQNLKNDPNEEYLSDGMTEALITQLGMIRGLRVISHQSVMHYKGTLKTVPQIARELGVTVLVEGAMLREGQTIRISIQVIRAQPEEHIWAQTYERSLENVLRLESELARDIAGQMQVRLSSQQQAKLGATREVNAEAHEAYLRAWYLLNGRTTQGVEKAIGYFQDAIGKDPSYAPAYGGLAVAHYLLPIYADRLPASVTSKVKQAAEAALAIDPTQADAYTARGWVETVYEYRWKEGEADLKRGVDLNPTNSNARVAYGMALIFLNRHAEAITELQRAHENDPLSPFAASFLGYGMLMAHRDTEAETELQKALELDPHFHHTLAVLALVHSHKAKCLESTEAIEKAVSLAGANISLQPARQAYVYALCGRGDDARSIADRLSHPARSKYVPAYYLAATFLALGDRDRALQLLHQAYDTRDYMLPYLRSDPIWDPIRADGRFRRLVGLMNFPD
jgi:TolB-like protein/DNA-binding winged helix-turn-helix (wHTH) protein/Tfp pilus assembly protein PilF